VYEEYISNEKFIEENNIITGIKVDKFRNIYVTVPRWRPGVPATLNKLVKADETSDGEFVLEPYPSWDIQQEGVEGDLQNVQSMTIDSKNRMWVIEVGRRNFLPPYTSIDGNPGIWIIDLNTGVVISKYYFPSSVAPNSTTFLNDIVLDETLDVAYLSDADLNGGIIVYDLNQQSSKRYTGPSTERNANLNMMVNGISYGTDTLTTPSDGIAISNDYQYIYYCALQGDTLYRLPAALLRNFAATQEEIDAAVVTLGSKPPSDGIQVWGDVLYYGSLPESTYYAVPLNGGTTTNITDGAVPIWPQLLYMRWVFISLNIHIMINKHVMGAF
jgi:hypothetical protein